MLRFVTINIIVGIVLTVLIILHLSYGIIAWWAYFLLGIFWLQLTVIGSFHMRWNYHLKSLHSNKSISQNHIALTFDDGPHPEFTPKILALLKEFDMHATFFCIGKNMEVYPEMLQKIIDAGHLVGNHTYSHSNFFGFFSTKRVVAELQKTNSIIYEITGKKVRLYRPAFGVTNPNIKKAVHATSMKSIGWNVRSLDTTNRPEDIILKRITKKLAKGDIVLLHDTSVKTVNVLEQLLLFLKKKQLQSVSVDQLLAIEAYA